MPRPGLSDSATGSPLLTRLRRLGAVSVEAQGALAAAITLSVPVAARRDLATEGGELGPPRAIVSGWAARMRLLADGRRQIVSLLLPGDLIGVRRQVSAISPSTVIAITEVAVALLPHACSGAGLADAYAMSSALEEAHLLAQIARLGRFTAQERIADMLLELFERLGLAGLTDPDGFAMPLTQEMVADSLGLTPVHVNRMLQVARRSGEIVWRPGRVTLVDPATLAQKIGRSPVVVSRAFPRY